MDNHVNLSDKDRPKTLLVRFMKWFGILCLIISIPAILLGLFATAEEHAPLREWGLASRGLAMQALFILALSFLLDKLDEQKWFAASQLERRAIFASRKKRHKNAKNK